MVRTNFIEEKHSEKTKRLLFTGPKPEYFFLFVYNKRAVAKQKLCVADEQLMLGLSLPASFSTVAMVQANPWHQTAFLFAGYSPP